MSCNEPSVAASDSGDMMLTWRDSAGSSRPWGQFYSAETGWEDAQMLVSEDDYGSGNTRAVFSSGGSLMVVWQRRLSMGCELHYRVREQGEWHDSAALDECEQDSGPLALASYDQHGFHIIYHRPAQDVAGSETWEARWVGGRGLVEQRMLLPAATWNSWPTLALDPDGRGLLVWRYREEPQASASSELRYMWLQ